MAENRLKEPEEENTAESSKKSNNRYRASRKRRRGSLFSSFNINAYYLFENIHFIFYLAFLGIIYIANSHYAVNTIKEIKGLQYELKKISWESNSRKSELMFESMESRVAEKVHHMGLRELEEHPKKIIIPEK